MSEDLKIIYVPVGKKPTFGGKYTVTASNGQTIHMDIIRLASDTDQRKFCDAVMAKAPGLDRTRVETELLRTAADENTRLADEKTREIEAKTKPAPDTAESLLASMPDQVKAEAQRMLRSENLIEQVVLDIEAIGVAGERKLTTTEYLIGVSRLLAKPLAAIVQGPTSSGKNHTYDTTARLFPPEAVIHAKQMTPQALFHMPQGSLMHKWVVAGERARSDSDETADTTRALREMLSSGGLTKLMPIKTANGIETQLIHQDGPIAYIESTTLTKIFDEDANRCLLLQTDEREDQTKRIIRMIAERRSGAAVVPPDMIIERHYALQRMLKQMVVVIPYATKLADHFPFKRTEARRAFGHMLSMVEACALLHQCQRQTDADGRLIASIDDYQTAKRLLDSPMARLLGRRISDAARRFLDRLKLLFPGFQTFTTADLRKKEPSSDSSIKGWLRELLDAGNLEIAVESHGNKPATWKLSEVPPEDDMTAALPAIEVIQ